MKIHNHEQGTKEWFDVRLGKFTASDAQAIASNGKGLETLAYKKVAEVLTRKQEDSYTNGDIERGHELEEEARSAYELSTGNIVVKVGFCELNEHDGCSPDGLVKEDGLAEFKCVNDANFVKFLHTRKIDTAHVWQMQDQMRITNRKWCDYCVYNPNFENPLIIVRVERDEVAIATLIKGIATGIALKQEILSKVQPTI